MPEGLLPPVLVELRANITDFKAKMGEARTDIAKTADSTSFDKLATVGKAALMGVAGAAVGVGAVALKMADAWEQSHARLITAVHNLNENFSSIEGPLGSVEKKMEGFGFTNADVENAVARLAPATGSTSKAISEMALAADIAKARHMSLEDATQLLVKVQTGHVALLGRLGINVKDANGKLLDQDAAMKRLADTYGGAAKNNAETFAGKMQALKASSEDIAKNIGVALIPILEKAATVTADVIKWFEKHRTVAIALGIVVGGALLVAIGAYVVSMAAAAVATIAATWPILAIIAAVAAVAVGVGYLATHWREVWAEIQQLVGAAVDWIKSHFYVLVTIVGLPVVALYELYTHWSQIWAAITGVLSSAWNAIVNFFTSLPGNIVNGLESAAPAILAWWITLPIRILGLLASAAIWLVETGVHIIEGLAHGVEVGAVLLWNWYTSLPGRILSLLAAAGSWLLNTGIDILKGLVNGAEQGAIALWNWYTSLPGRIVGAIGDVGSWLLQTGKDLISGLIHGIESMAGNLANSVVNTVKNAVPGPIKSLLGISSPSKLMMEYGGYVMEGLRLGIVNEQGRLAGDVARVANTVTRLGSFNLGVSGNVLSGASGGAVASLGFATAVSGGTTVNVGGITVLQQPGEDSAALARRIRDELRNYARNNQTAVPVGLR